MRDSVEVEIPEIKPYKLKDKIMEFIRNNPNCTLADLYHLKPKDEGGIRRSVSELIHGRRIKQCLVALD